MVAPGLCGWCFHWHRALRRRAPGVAWFLSSPGVLCLGFPCGSWLLRLLVAPPTVEQYCLGLVSSAFACAFPGVGHAPGTSRWSWFRRVGGVLPGTVAASYASAGSLMRRCCIVWSATRPHDAWCCTNGAPTVLRCGDVFPPSLRSSVLARWLRVSWGVKGNNVYICMVSCI